MADDSGTTERSFLRRWSQRKLAAAREAEAPEPREPATPLADVAPTPIAQPSTPPAEQPGELPSPESLTFDSDFTPFLQPSVDPGLRQQALRKLFSDPRFNVMDGLDVYIDDYGKSDPIPPEILKQLRHAKFLFDPPKTRVNADGHVEDVPDEDVAAAEQPTVAAVASLPPDAPAEAPAGALQLPVDAEAAERDEPPKSR